MRLEIDIPEPTEEDKEQGRRVSTEFIKDVAWQIRDLLGWERGYNTAYEEIENTLVALLQMAEEQKEGGE